MNGTATPRYGFHPQVPFAATRAWAQAHEKAAAGPSGARRRHAAGLLIRRLARLHR